MKKILVLLGVVISLILVACGGGGAENSLDGRTPVSEEPKFGSASGTPTATPAPSVIRAPAVMPTPAAVFASESSLALPVPAKVVLESDSFQPQVLSSLEVTQRKIISNASIAVEVEVVQTAITEVRTIAESLGGFVEHLSSSGSPEHQRATMTIRVPQDQFFSALERIETLGEVQSQSVGSEDVSEQFIDLEARLKSSLREEQSLLSLLEKTEGVGEILAIERELSRIRSEIERLQGQLNFLERRVDLATIGVTLIPPREEFVEPPSAALTIGVSKVTASVDEIKSLVSSLNGEVDRVILSVRDGEESANVSLRIFPSDFEQTLASLERQGDVVSKELREGKDFSDSEVATREEPDARIDVALFKAPDSSNTGLIIAIAAPTGGVGLALVLGLLVYAAYRVGRRRSSSS